MQCNHQPQAVLRHGLRGAQEDAALWRRLPGEHRPHRQGLLLLRPHPGKLLVLEFHFCSRLANNLSATKSTHTHPAHPLQISYADTDPIYTIENYPNFFRVVPSENALSLARIPFIQHFNWTRVGTIYQNLPRYSLVSISVCVCSPVGLVQRVASSELCESQVQLHLRVGAHLAAVTVMILPFEWRRRTSRRPLDLVPSVEPDDDHDDWQQDPKRIH